MPPAWFILLFVAMMSVPGGARPSTVIGDPESLTVVGTLGPPKDPPLLHYQPPLSALLVPLSAAGFTRSEPSRLYLYPTKILTLSQSSNSTPTPYVTGRSSKIPGPPNTPKTPGPPNTPKVPEIPSVKPPNPPTTSKLHGIVSLADISRSEDTPGPKLQHLVNAPFPKVPFPPNTPIGSPGANKVPASAMTYRSNPPKPAIQGGPGPDIPRLLPPPPRRNFPGAPTSSSSSGHPTSASRKGGSKTVETSEDSAVTQIKAYSKPVPIPSSGRALFSTINVADGSYHFGYDTGSGQHQSYREERRFPGGRVEGRYGYVDAVGVLRIVEYTADQRGYRSKLTVHNPSIGPSIIGPIPPPLIPRARSAAAAAAAAASKSSR